MQILSFKKKTLFGKVLLSGEVNGKAQKLFPSQNLQTNEALLLNIIEVDRNICGNKL